MKHKEPEIEGDNIDDVRRELPPRAKNYQLEIQYPATTATFRTKAHNRLGALLNWIEKRKKDADHIRPEEIRFVNTEE